MKTHTPGPWSVRASFSGNSALHITSAADENIAAVRSDDNARLIAAAPELLAALRGLINNSTRADWPADLYNAAEAAIAKASP
jgi:hypothetical protein